MDMLPRAGELMSSLLDYKSRCQKLIEECECGLMIEKDEDIAKQKKIHKKIDKFVVFLREVKESSRSHNPRFDFV